MEALLLDCIWLQSHHIQLPQATEWYGGETICQALSLQPGAFPEATLSVAHCVQAIVLGGNGRTMILQVHSSRVSLLCQFPLSLLASHFRGFL